MTNIPTEPLEDRRPTMQWVITILISVIMFLSGGAFADYRSYTKMKEIQTTIDAHKEEIGHPVIVERVNSIKIQLQNIENKLDKLLERKP